MAASFKLYLSKNMLEYEGMPYLARTGESIRVAVTVEAKSAPKGQLILKWDKMFADLKIGSTSVDLPDGTYRQEVEWLLEPSVQDGIIEFEVEARAGSFFQKVMLPVRVQPKV